MMHQTEIRMPKLSPKSDQYFFGTWEKQVGEHVQKGEVLFEVESEKVISEVPSEVTGVVAEQRVDEGATVKAGEVVAVVTVAND